MPAGAVHAVPAGCSIPTKGNQIMNKQLLVAAGIAALVASGPASALLVGIPAAIPGPRAVIDFNGFAEPNGFFGTPAAPIAVGPYTTIHSGSAILLGAPEQALAPVPGPWTLGPDPFSGNGQWGLDLSGMNKFFAGVDAVGGTMTFSFSMPVGGVGAFLNAWTQGGPASITLRAFGAGGLLQEHVVNVTTAADSINAGEFYGIVADGITAFSITGDFVVADDLVIAVPLPPALALFAGGLAAFGWLARRNRARA
jgi:hypothetical protein